MTASREDWLSMLANARINRKTSTDGSKIESNRRASLGPASPFNPPSSSFVKKRRINIEYFGELQQTGRPDTTCSRLPFPQSLNGCARWPGQAFLAHIERDTTRTL